MAKENIIAFLVHLLKRANCTTRRLDITMLCQAVHSQRPSIEEKRITSDTGPSNMHTMLAFHVLAQQMRLCVRLPARWATPKTLLMHRALVCNEVKMCTEHARAMSTLIFFRLSTSVRCHIRQRYRFFPSLSPVPLFSCVRYVLISQYVVADA